MGLLHTDLALFDIYEGTLGKENIQWCQLESLRVLFYEAKVPSSDGNSII